MKKQVKIALCVSAVVIALVVLFNLLPSGIRARPCGRPHGIECPCDR